METLWDCIVVGAGAAGPGMGGLLGSDGRCPPAAPYVAGREVSPAVPHYKAPCWFTLDPASLLVTGHYDRGQTPELVATEADT